MTTKRTHRPAALTNCDRVLLFGFNFFFYGIKIKFKN